MSIEDVCIFYIYQVYLSELFKIQLMPKKPTTLSESIISIFELNKEKIQNGENIMVISQSCQGGSDQTSCAISLCTKLQRKGVQLEYQGRLQSLLDSLHP